MELTQLYYFYITAKYENVSLASKEVNIAQPALTKAIHHLEDELEISLFKREGRNIKLTKWGYWLKNNIDGPLNKLYGIKNEIKKIKLDNHIRICARVASNFVTSAMLSFKKKYNNVSFSLMLSDEDDSDILIKTSNTGFNEKIYLASGNVYYNKINKIEDIRVIPFITFTQNKELRGTIDKFFKENGIKPNITFECETINSVHDLISSNNGIGFIPEFTSGALRDDLIIISNNDFIINRYIEVKKNDYGMCNIKILNEFYDYLCECFKNKKIMA